ncbi:MAG: hypothetical protein P1V36_14360 [Planctomycetota bacterium]|nr:hypothetical protein [Planctomycetota bacterium]
MSAAPAPNPGTAHATTAVLCLFLAVLMIASVPLTLYGPMLLVFVQVLGAVLFLSVGIFHLKRARASRRVTPPEQRP